MNTFQLSCFLAAANTLSFAKAAEQMNVSQPAITHQIKTLENELNVKLFNRSTRVVELTLEGRAFVTDAKSMVTIAEQAKLRFRSPEDRPINFLSLGCSSYHQLTLLSGALKELAQEAEHLHPQLHVAPHEQLIHMMDTEAVDLVFDMGSSTGFRGHTVFQELLQSEIVCVCAKDHPLSGRDTITLDELKKEPLIFCDPLNMSPDIVRTQWELAEGRSPADIHFCGSADAALVLVTGGFGAAILPGILVPDGDAIEKIALENAVKIPYGLYYRPHPGDGLLKSFIRTAKKYFSK